ncbi:sensor histidine kinase [Pseudoalteromonas citrea]|uniref:histidine kinase n=1 Tax=Pseudoalteromonas citrea TaxID=43655 RepID=A0A5S3XNB2_9GAMM|nr:ATP-binding protein [Pseudoalteromonas citrea]TMP41371.1 sensor histidine kinase [Pseudoalteromonas citrea]TMP57061.1 sensor histidine kinase [Pseudoalteromonas citrea]
MKHYLASVFFFFNITFTGIVLAQPSFNDVDVLINQGQLTQAHTLLKTLERSGKFDENKTKLKLAKVLRKQNRYDDAIMQLNTISLINLPSKALLYDVTKELGINYRRSHQLKIAKKHYLKALKIAKSLNNKSLIGQSYNNLGSLYDAKNNVALSMEYHLKAQKFLETSKDWEMKASNFYNLGDLSVRIHNFDQAEHFFNEALINDKKSEEVKNIADTAIRLAEIKLKNNKYNEALDQFIEVISILKPLEANANLARAYNSLHRIYLKLDNPHMALSSVQHSLNHALKTQSPIRKANAYLHLIELHIQLKNTDLLELYLPKAQELLKDIDDKKLDAQLQYANAQYRMLKNQHEEAYYALLSAFAIHKLADQEITQGATEQYKRQVNALVQYQKLAQTEQKSAVMKVELEKQILQKRTWLLACIIILLFSVVTVYLYVIKHRNAQYKASLYQANLKQKDQMLADISHELRTPLSVLQLHIEALEHNLLDDKVLAYTKINNKMSQLNNLISDVYQLSQVQNQSIHLIWQECQLSTLTSHYIADMKTLAEQSNLRFIADIDIPDATIFTTDKQKLDQIITNLAKNACLYTDSPGHIRLKVRVNTKHIFIQIDDSTPGVSEAELNKLFERLYRIDKSRSRALGGSGLGLSICEGLTHALQGDIKLHHGKSGGLCVRIILPIIPTKE